ncbi:helix-turn-helix domain-containing protein [Luteolibacter pohnpeiensis]
MGTLPQDGSALSITQLSRLMGVSTQTVRDRVHAGLIKRIPNSGKRILIPRDEAERLLTGESRPKLNN